MIGCVYGCSSGRSCHRCECWSLQSGSRVVHAVAVNMNAVRLVWWRVWLAVKFLLSKEKREKKKVACQSSVMSFNL